METLYKDDELPSHLQRLVDAGVSGLDIMHGELKNLMLIAEEQKAEERLDTLVELYKLTYDLSFAIGARNEA
jgi:hypothetical protein